jgi:hypothetical protein
MTDPGFAAAFQAFDTEVDAAVVRARRVAAEARETSAKFRRETRQLAEHVKADAAPRPEPVTTPSPFRTTGSRRVIARRGDDDEDFSHEQIMR